MCPRSSPRVLITVAPALVVFVCLVVPSRTAHTRVIVMTVDEMIATSDVIALGKVVSVKPTTAAAQTARIIGKALPGHSSSDGSTAPREALLVVSETWKGPHSAQLRFLATGMWGCDVSYANIGEHVLVFLKNQADADLMTISHWGRGRMPVHTDHTGGSVELSAELVWSSATKTSAPSSVSLATLKKWVLSYRSTELR